MENSSSSGVHRDHDSKESSSRSVLATLTNQELTHQSYEAADKQSTAEKDWPNDSFPHSYSFGDPNVFHQQPLLPHAYGYPPPFQFAPPPAMRPYATLGPPPPPPLGPPHHGYYNGNYTYFPGYDPSMMAASPPHYQGPLPSQPAALGHDVTATTRSNSPVVVMIQNPSADTMHNIYNLQEAAKLMDEAKRKAVEKAILNQAPKSRKLYQRWSEEEDAALTRLVQEWGPKRWRHIAAHLPGRTNKQCQERWKNHLAPELEKGAITWSERLAILQAQAAGRKPQQLTLPGRSDTFVRNNWHNLMRRKARVSSMLEVCPVVASSSSSAEQPSSSSSFPATDV
jgi:Myb-like DNA-binding domain